MCSLNEYLGVAFDYFFIKESVFTFNHPGEWVKGWLGSAFNFVIG